MVVIDSLCRALLALLVVFASVSQAQSRDDSPDRPASLSRVIQTGHYDLWVKDYSSFAEEAVHQALRRGYYLSTAQRRELLRRARARFSPAAMGQRLVREMQQYAGRASVRSVRSWYGSDIGNQTLLGIQHAYQVGADKRQQKIRLSLEADRDRSDWWARYNSIYPFAQTWLSLRQKSLLANISHIAQTMKPYTPFDAEHLREQLELETFNLRPDVERQIMWRYMDSLGRLDTPEYVRYKSFTISDDHADFVQLIARASGVVVNTATAEFKEMLADAIEPAVAPTKANVEFTH